MCYEQIFFSEVGKEGDSIGRVNGKCAIVSKKCLLRNLHNQLWLCKVTKEFDNFVVVEPIYRLR